MDGRSGGAEGPPTLAPSLLRPTRGALRPSPPPVMPLAGTRPPMRQTGGRCPDCNRLASWGLPGARFPRLVAAPRVPQRKPAARSARRRIRPITCLREATSTRTSTRMAAWPPGTWPGTRPPGTWPPAAGRRITPIIGGHGPGVTGGATTTTGPRRTPRDRGGRPRDAAVRSASRPARAPASFGWRAGRLVHLPRAEPDLVSCPLITRVISSATRAARRPAPRGPARYSAGATPAASGGATNCSR